MAGRGPAPKANAQRRNPSDRRTRGDWQATPGVGWQHGAIPTPPAGLMPASRTAWETWMQSWVAAHWTALDLPGLRQLIRLYDQVERGEFQRATELRLGMDTYGITPKGQQDRRWQVPEEPEQRPAASSTPATGRFAHLKVVNE